MRQDKIRAHCPSCRHQQIFIEDKINHPLHLTLVFLTGGLWLVSWIAICIGKFLRPWRCEHCGWHKPEFGVRLREHPQPAKQARPTLQTARVVDDQQPSHYVAAETSRLTP